MQPELPGCLRIQHNLIGAARIGHPAADYGDPVLIEVQAVDAANGTHREASGDARLRWPAVLAQEVGDGLHADPDPPDLGQVAHRAGKAGGRHKNSTHTERSGQKGWCWPGRRKMTTRSGWPRLLIPGPPRRSGQSAGPSRGSRPTCAPKWTGTGTRRLEGPDCSRHHTASCAGSRYQRPRHFPYRSVAQPSTKAKGASQHHRPRVTTIAACQRSGRKYGPGTAQPLWAPQRADRRQRADRGPV